MTQKENYENTVAAHVVVSVGNQLLGDFKAHGLDPEKNIHEQVVELVLGTINIVAYDPETGFEYEAPDEPMPDCDYEPRPLLLDYLLKQPNKDPKT
jgi:hypothetical protein